LRGAAVAVVQQMVPVKVVVALVAIALQLTS
jgi:hypothetical protein